MEEKKGRILKALSGFYYVLIDNSIITCRASGNLRNKKFSPLVGDIVNIKIEESSLGYIVSIDDRENELLRPRVSNIDYNILVTSLKEPNFDSKLLSKLIILNENSNIKTIILFTKVDLLTDEEKFNAQDILDYYRKLGYTSLYNNDEGLSRLKEIIKNSFVSISGQSGSGKSTFVNNLSNNKFEIETASISKSLGRGKHTTRHVEFHNIDDFYIADTPGFSSLDLTFIEKEDLKYGFLEFRNRECRYQSCNHIEEPKCAVKEYLELNEDSYFNIRYNDYKELFKEKEDIKKRRY